MFCVLHSVNVVRQCISGVLDLFLFPRKWLQFFTTISGLNVYMNNKVNIKQIIRYIIASDTFFVTPVETIGRNPAPRHRTMRMVPPVGRTGPIAS